MSQLGVVPSEAVHTWQHPTVMSGVESNTINTINTINLAACRGQCLHHIQDFVWSLYLKAADSFASSEMHVRWANNFKNLLPLHTPLWHQIRGNCVRQFLFWAIIKLKDRADVIDKNTSQIYNIGSLLKNTVIFPAAGPCLWDWVKINYKCVCSW